jgi:hypothetical protein
MNATQSYASHAHLPRLFFVGFFAWAVAVVCFGLMLFGYNTQLIAAGAGLIALFPALFMGRLYVTALQDRIIRGEMRARCEKLVSAEQMAAFSKLSLKQIAALRFASDQELPGLISRAAAEGLTSDQIKKAVTTWLPDFDRT